MHALSEVLTRDPITHAAADPRLKVPVQCTVPGAAEASEGVECLCRVSTASDFRLRADRVLCSPLIGTKQLCDVVTNFIVVVFNVFQ